MTDQQVQLTTVDAIAENPALTMARIGFNRIEANTCLDFPESIRFTGTKVDGSFSAITLTSSIEVSDNKDEWFSLSVGYLDTVKAASLDKSPLVVNGKQFKRPSEKVTVIKPLITFYISKAGVISHTKPSDNWIVDTGLGNNYGSYVFDFLHALIDKWENPLTLLFILLYTQATEIGDRLALKDDNGLEVKGLAYKPLTLEQRLEAFVNHHNILVEQKHNSRGSFSGIASKAAKVLDKMQAEKLAATKTTATKTK